jgi:hypothetical protein
LGGKVVSSIPIQGYVLIKVGTPEGDRLVHCWTTPDRPTRYFVPYTFVDACKVTGKLVKPVFTQHGMPLKIHIHPSIANDQIKESLATRIMVRFVLYYSKSL